MIRKRNMSSRIVLIMLWGMAMFCCCMLLPFVKSAEDTDDNWIELGEDASMPVGGHVRINMTSGKKHLFVPSTSRNDDLDGLAVAVHQNEVEADIAIDVGLSKKDIIENALNLELDHDTNPEKSEFDESARIEDVLLRLPNPPDALVNTAAKKLKREDPEKYASLLKQIWEKRQAELKEAYEAMNDEVKMIKDVLLSMLEKVQNETMNLSNSKDLLADLLYLEDMVQDVDKANDFFSLGGVETLQIIRQADNSPQIVENIWYVIGSASKFNENIQKKIISSMSLYLSDDIEEFCLDPNSGKPEVCKKIIYALGSLLRGNKIVQEISVQDITLNFLNKTIGIFENYDASWLQVKQKVLNLISDLINEATGDQLFIELSRAQQENRLEDIGIYSLPEFCTLLFEIEENQNHPVSYKSQARILRSVISCDMANKHDEL